MNSPENGGPMSARANEDLASYLHVNQVRREIVIDGCGEKVVQENTAQSIGSAELPLQITGIGMPPLLTIPLTGRSKMGDAMSENSITSHGADSATPLSRKMEQKGKYL